MKTILRPLIILSIVFLAHEAHSQIVSDFSVDADGWKTTDLSGGSVATVTYSSTSGNPGGFISQSINSSSPQYWSAPAKFLGNRAYASYGEALTFDIETVSTLPVHSASGDIMMINSGNQSIYVNVTTLPSGANTWTSMSIQLDETSPWRSGAISNPLATRDQIIAVLSDLTAIRIYVEWKSNPFGVQGSLDNVVMGVRPALQPAPTITSINPTTAAQGSNITITGTNFGANTSNNTVLFGSVTGTIVSASSTSIVVTVPTAADYGPVTVVNTTSNLSARSTKKFTPTFASGGGGTILKGSFLSDVLYNKQTSFLGHGDINGDGKPEMFATYATQVSIFENASTPGSITTSSFINRLDIDPSLASGYSDIGADDFDGDGKLDIFFAERDNPDAGRVLILRNIYSGGPVGASSFATFEEYTFPPYTLSEATSADLDGDGKPELIGWGSSCGPNPVYILQNISTVGKIRFTSAIGLSGASSCSGRYQIADIDVDGKLDIIETTGAETRIFRNISTVGSLSFETGYDVGDGGNVCAIGDLDNDGKPDIAYANGGMKIIKNLSTPGVAFSTASFQSPIIFATGSALAKIADMNGDGKPDIIVGTGSVGVYQNVSVDGQINTSSFLPLVAVETDHNATEIDIYDIDVDGRPDIVSNNGAQGTISINRNVVSPQPTISGISPTIAAPGATVTITGTNFSTVAADNTIYFAGAKATVTNATATSLDVTVPDGATYSPVSVVVRGFSLSSPQFFTPTFSGGYSFNASAFAAGVDVTLTGTIADGLSVMDYDGDGKIDILADNGSGTIAARNVGSDGVINATTFGTPYTAASQGAHVIGSDLDGDGKPDVVTSTSIYRNVSDAALPNPIAFENLVTRDNGPGSTRFAGSRDLNKDGKVDVIYTSAPSSIYVAENLTRVGTFAQAGGALSSMGTDVSFPKPSGNGSTAVADFDGDGFYDIVANTPTTDNFTAYLSAGHTGALTTASFNAGTNFATGDNPYGITVLDFDGDGKMDVANTNFINGPLATISVYRNVSTLGNINFTRQDFPATAGPTAIAAADMDGDGKPDLVVINESSNSFSIFRNKSTTGVLDANSFEAKVDYTTTTSPRGLAIADIDRDMRPDVIVTRTTSTISIFKNLVPTGPNISLLQQPTNKVACENGVATFTVAATGASNLTYQWQLFNTGTSTYGDIAGATSATLTVDDITLAMNGSIYRCKINGDGASEKISSEVNITTSAAPSAPTTSGATACKGSSQVLTAGGGIDGLYRWYDSPTLQQPINGEVNSTFTTPVVFTTTTYYAAIANSNGCVSARTAAVATIAPLTKPVITSTGTLLCGVNEVTISGPAGFAGYNWSSGASTQDIDVNIKGLYSLIVEDANGCQSLESDPIEIEAGSVPKPIIDANKNKLCSDGDEVILTAPAGFAGYEWSNGATDQSITVTEEGVFNVNVTNDSGCHSETSDDFNVTIGADKPVISAGNNVLVSTPAKTYQWFFGDAAIPDGTKQFLDYSPFAYGSYTVQVTDFSGCSATSDVYVNLVTGIGEQSIGNAVYPNPFGDVLVINVDADDAKLFDSTGKEIRQLIKGGNDVSSLARGLYFVRIKNGSELKTIKVSK